MTKSEKGMQGCFKNDRRTYDPAVVLDRHHFLMDIVTDFISSASFIIAG
jgi:hypothetical protein